METAAEAKHSGTEPEIHLFAPQTESSDSVIPVRWCLCKALFDELKSQKARNPQLLLVVAGPDGEEVSCKLLPLEQSMEYVSFRKPGKHFLLAVVVWRYDGDVKLLRKEFVKRDSYGYRWRNLLREREYDKEGHLRSGDPCLKNFNGGTISQRGPTSPILTVDVAAEFFAKPHSEWLNRWVNFWFENKHPVDQCQFRRRAILAFTFQPIAMFFYIIGLFLARFLIAAFLISLGKRKIKLAPVVRLFKYDTNDIWWENKCQKLKSVFTTTRQGEKKPFFWRCFSPIYILIISGIVVAVDDLLAYALKTSGPSFVQSVVRILSLWLGSFLGFYLLYLMDLLCKWLDRKINEASLENRDAREKQEKELAELRDQRLREEALKRYDTQYQELVCPGIPLEPSLDALPSHRRTVHLRFLDFKAKVCKPFAR